jgi:hypothetical protein
MFVHIIRGPVEQTRVIHIVDGPVGEMSDFKPALCGAWAGTALWVRVKDPAAWKAVEPLARDCATCFKF